MSKLKQDKKVYKYRNLVVAISFAIIGLVTLLITSASAHVAWFEVESAQLSTSVINQPDQSASGGAHIKFGDGSSTNSDCALPKYPTPACTGVPPGTVLTDHTPGQDLDATTPGQIIDGVRVSANLIIKANNVVVRNSEIHGAIVNINDYSFTVEDMTIGPPSGCQTTYSGISNNNYTARRIEVRNTGDGFRAGGSNILIEDSFVLLCATEESHSDGIQGYISEQNVVFRHNTVDQRIATATGGATSPVFFADGSKTAIIQNNLLLGGGYSIRLHDDNEPDVGPWEATGNRVAEYVYGPTANDGTDCSQVTWSDNRIVTIDSNYNILSLGAEFNC